jgi:glycosyltransferase involved in cell wall biosynthesis
LKDIHQTPISVVISTYNRGESITATINSIIATDYSNFELHIIDQSDNDLTQKAIAPFLNDPRFHYLKSKTRGCSSGRNEGIKQAPHELIAITDDDCEVPVNWLQEMVKALEIDNNLGAVFGNVVAGEFDPAQGFIPTHIINKPYLATSIKQKNKVRGISANMGLRKSIWAKVHGFDSMLGAGAPFNSSSEGDYTLKLLAAGFYIYETPRLCLVHNGFRSWEDGKKLAKRNWSGIGSMIAKHFKQDLLLGLRLIGYEWGYVACRQAIIYSIKNRRISRITPIIYFWKGFFAGLFTPIEPETGNFYSFKLSARRLGQPSKTP